MLRPYNMIQPLKDAFVAAATPFIASHMTGAQVVGVSFVPMHVYSAGPAKALIGKACVVLGKEKGHVHPGFNNKFNFFGGKTTDKARGNVDARTVAEVLFEEVYEEFGIALTYDLFATSNIGVASKPYGANGCTLIFFHHIAGISRGWWDRMMDARKSLPCLPWRYQEMSQIDHVSVDDISVRDDLSVYVDDCHTMLKGMASVLPFKPAVGFSKFPAPPLQ